jgi:N-methylhydantoinase A
VNVSVKATYRRPKPSSREQDPAVDAPPPTVTSQRVVFLPEARRTETIPIYSERDFVPGATVAGPSIIDVGDTTVYVPEGATCGRDRFFNFTVTN